MKGKRIIKTGIIIFIIGFVFACILAKIGYDYCFRRGGNYDANEQHYPRSTVRKLIILKYNTLLIMVGGFLLIITLEFIRAKAIVQKAYHSPCLIYRLL